MSDEPTRLPVTPSTNLPDVLVGGDVECETCGHLKRPAIDRTTRKIIGWLEPIPSTEPHICRR